MESRVDGKQRGGVQRPLDQVERGVHVRPHPCLGRFSRIRFGTEIDPAHRHVCGTGDLKRTVRPLRDREPQCLCLIENNPVCSLKNVGHDRPMDLDPLTDVVHRAARP
ncbi:hypothetical protein Stube_04280 [Streptomyces tubercidicus]|uniref:Uncharacterized protein n=1 Tax=Streptomyces tubercidicus TaxID=47759 RepID=A0A640UN86_9ACTN|nr:hypothetical protein Stube_04280 [Streptomyces tubercidicus]